MILKPNKYLNLAAIALFLCFGVAFCNTQPVSAAHWQSTYAGDVQVFDSFDECIRSLVGNNSPYYNSAANNEAINWVCNQRSGSGWVANWDARGAMWINANASGDIYASTSTAPASSGSITVYLRGRISGSDTPDAGASMIRFLTSSASSTDRNWDPLSSGYREVNWLSRPGNLSYLNRGHTYDIPWRATWSTDTGGFPITLNLDAFKNGAASCGDKCYYRSVYVYRCYEPNFVSCGTNVSTIRLIIPDDQPQTCSSSNVKYSANYGNTAAQSTVLNSTLAGDDPNNRPKGSYAETSFDALASTAFVYAKPGDSIRFSHALCFGAQAVQGNNGYQPGGAGRSTTTGNNNPNKFTVTAYLSGTKQDKYLFDNQPNIKSGVEVTLDKGKSSPSQVRNAETHYDYGFRFYSPGDSSKDTYRCDVSSLLGSFKNSNFRIPDFRDYVAACAAARKVGANSVNGQYSNAGQVIEQRLTFNNVERWVNTKTNLVTGGCDCKNFGNHAYPRSISSYSQATSDKSGSWGDVLHDCEYEGTCCCGYRTATSCSGSGENYSCSSYTYCYSNSCSKYRNNSRDYYTHYGISANDTAGGAKSAQAIIPYNFKTSVTSTINTTDPVVYGGDKVDVTLDYSILGRRNPDVDPNNDYATITPKYTQIKPIEFIVPANRADTFNAQGGTSTKDPCAYFGYAEDGAHCNAFNVQTGSQNPEGNYRGSTGQIAAKDNTARTIPDQEVGQLYCVAVGIFPADSHNQPDSDLGSGVNALGRAFNGQDGNTSNQWRISGASCRTIAKKPAFQVWNGGVATEGAISTALTKKNIGASFGNYDEANTRIFGSWDEQLVIAGEEIKGFASGATLGYNPATYNFGLPGGHAFTEKFPDLSTLTISNDGATMGNSHISLPITVVERILARYSNLNTDSSPWVADPSTGGRRNSDTGLEYINLGAGGTISGAIKGVGDPTKDNTRIYYSSGTINITGDLCYGSSCGDDSTKLSAYNNLSSTSLAALPQIIIIAKDINIDHNVTRVDAWLVTENQLDTCTHDSGQRYEFGAAFTSDQCGQPLIINGPTFAGQLRLMRTAGAKPGTKTASGDILNRSLKEDGTMAPAEIFNLRADTYFWAYAQAQRYSEAVTTYTRELAPRL